MPRRETLAVEQRQRQRRMVEARQDPGRGLKETGHAAHRREQATEVAEDEHEHGDDRIGRLGVDHETHEDAEDGKG